MNSLCRSKSARDVRLTLYSHDTYGLGHLRRTVRIARRLLQRSKRVSVEILSGSRVPDAFHLPSGCRVVSLPPIVKTGRLAYRSADPDRTIDEVLALRANLILERVRAFQPHLILVDHAPVGASGELKPLLQALKEGDGSPFLVLGLRDIVDSAERTRNEWEALGAMDAIENQYDHILVYGDSRVLTTAQELGLPEILGDRLSYTGFIGQLQDPVQCDPLEPPLFVGACGGGGDGQLLSRSFVEALAKLPTGFRYQARLHLGPLMHDDDVMRLRRQAEVLRPHLEVTRFHRGFVGDLAACRAVVAMGGYNTSVEILAAGCQALIIPRLNHREEQFLRAKRLAEISPLIQVAADPEDLPQRIATFLASGTAQSPGMPVPLDCSGLDRTASKLGEILSTDAFEVVERGLNVQ